MKTRAYHTILPIGLTIFVILIAVISLVCPQYHIDMIRVGITYFLILFLICFVD